MKMNIKSCFFFSLDNGGRLSALLLHGTVSPTFYYCDDKVSTVLSLESFDDYKNSNR